MLEKVEGIVLTERDYKESSKILNIMTKQHGIIGVIAKGSKSLKSNLRSVSTKLTYGHFHIYYKEEKLSTLVDVDLIDSFKKIRTNMDAISFASYLLELSMQVRKESPREEIYDLLISALFKMNEGYDPMVITNIIELKYLEFLGVMPVIDQCALCGSKTGITTLSSDSGGYVCKDCYTNQKMVSDKTIKLIRMFYYVDLSKITKLELSNHVKNEINEFLNDYYERYTGLYLKSKDFIKSLNKIS